jgi:hypothetical protein
MQNKELNYLEEDEYFSLHPDDIAEELASGLEEFEALRKETDEVFVFEEQEVIKGLGDINYPYTCYRVQGQSTPACKLTAPSDLPSSIRGIYKVDSGLSNVYSRKDTLMIGVQACVWSHFGKSGTATVSGMGAMRFNTTRPSTPTSQHNKGRAFDVKLQGRMLSNGSSYDQMACAYLCVYAVNAGAKRVIFSDQAVVDAVNKATGKNVCLMLGGHRNHIHLDNR